MSTGERRSRLSRVTPEVLVSVSQAVTRLLREAILQGRLRPGERLVQEELATELGVSRQPVREALRRLEIEGLIVQLPQRGFVVREYRDEDIRENYHLRQLLESEAARFAAQRIEPDELEELRALNRTLGEAVEAGDTSSMVEVNAQFHRLIHDSARMPQLTRLIQQLWVGHTVFTPLFVPGRAPRSVAEHEEILQALTARDPERAAATMREHIARAASDYFRRGTPSSPRGERHWDASLNTTQSNG